MFVSRVQIDAATQWKWIGVIFPQQTVNNLLWLFIKERNREVPESNQLSTNSTPFFFLQGCEHQLYYTETQQKMHRRRFKMWTTKGFLDTFLILSASGGILLMILTQYIYIYKSIYSKMTRRFQSVPGKYYHPDIQCFFIIRTKVFSRLFWVGFDVYISQLSKLDTTSISWMLIRCWCIQTLRALLWT